MFRLRVCLLLGLTTASAYGLQDATTMQQQQRASRAERPEEKPAHELSTEQRKRANQLLKNATANTSDLSPAMRAYALSQLARAYSLTQPAKVPSLLEDAFQAALGMAPEERFKSDLEQDILSQLLPVDRAKAEELLPQAEPSARKSVMSTLTERYIREKKFDQAHDEIQQIAQIDEFPYGAAIKLMLALPKEEAGLKQSIFSEALASYVAHSHKNRFSSGDFAEMVVRFHRILPANQIIQAIDEIFKQAKETDLTVRVGSAGGNATFNSYYEYRLFELLPALRDVDPGKADDLLR